MFTKLKSVVKYTVNSLVSNLNNMKKDIISWWVWVDYNPNNFEYNYQRFEVEYDMFEPNFNEVNKWKY